MNEENLAKEARNREGVQRRREGGGKTASVQGPREEGQLDYTVVLPERRFL